MFNQSDYRKTSRAVESGNRFQQVDCHVSFYIRPKSGMIQCRITINGDRAQWSTGIKARKADFDTKRHILKSDSRDTARLQALKTDILRIFKDRELTGRSLKPETIRDIALGLRGHDELIPTVLEALENYHQRQEDRLGANVVTESTLKRYRTYRKILTTYVTIKYGAKIKLDQLKPAMGQQLVDYLKGEKKYCHNYCVKILDYMKSILDYAVAYEWADRNVLKTTRLRKFKKEVKLLSMDDLSRLESMELETETLNQVRDMFLFCCYTGLAYADLTQLNRGHIGQVNGFDSIILDRKKSGQQAFIPIFPKAKALLVKYERNERCIMTNKLIPILSCQKANQWLKIIGQAAKIKEVLHTHMGRKTFTMYAEELGFTLNDTATMLGHTTATMTENHYFKHRREPIIRRLQVLFSEDEKNRKAS